jgi:hypothetical protein
MVCFQTKNPNLGKFWGPFNVGIFYDYLEYFMAIWYALWPFGIACGHLLYFSQFGMFGQRKFWQSCPVHGNRIVWQSLKHRGCVGDPHFHVKKGNFFSFCAWSATQKRHEYRNFYRRR